MYYRAVFVRLCSFIIRHPVFEAISLIVIVANSLFLAVETPDNSIFAAFDNIFLALYSVELALKVCGMGFVLNKGSYMRDPWNVLDFFIVGSGYLSLLLEN